MLKSFSDTGKKLSLERYWQCLPSSLYMALKRMNISSSSFEEFPVCPGCKYVYTTEESLETCGSRQRAKLCKTKIGHSVCNSDILTAKKTAKGTVFYPIQTYCFKKVSSLIANSVSNCSTFLTECESWRKEQQPVVSGFVLSDVYDGAIWKDFQSPALGSFLETPYNLVLQFNIDWFQPYDHVTYSVGAIYFTVLNLPAAERYKMKNVFLVAILPGPDEPKHDMNSFLKPLVDDLLNLRKEGIQVNFPDGSSVTVKCVVGCLACDIPASRKAAGFIGHSGRLGCSKCKKKFKTVGGFGGKVDYSGFSRHNWPKRSNQQHRSDVEAVKLCSSKTAREKMESELGCRYSVFL